MRLAPRSPIARAKGGVTINNVVSGCQSEQDGILAPYIASRSRATWAMPSRLPPARFSSRADWIDASCRRSSTRSSDTRSTTADLYFQSVRSEAWVLEDGIVKEGSHNIEQGVGVRAVSGEKSGFAYADEVALPALQQAAGAARAIASAGAEGKVQGRNVDRGPGTLPSPGSSSELRRGRSESSSSRRWMPRPEPRTRG